MPDTTHSVKVSAYADDTTCFVSNNEGFAALNEELQLYELAAGVRLNRMKSRGLWLGSWHSRQDAPLQIDWTSESIRILGLTVTRTYFNTVLTNWKDILQRLQTALAVWKKRDLSIFRESQSAAKICPVQGILRSMCSYNATAPNENVRKCDLVICLAGASTSCKAWSVYSIKGFWRTRCITPPI